MSSMSTNDVVIESMLQALHLHGRLDAMLESEFRKHLDVICSYLLHRQDTRLVPSLTVDAGRAKLLLVGLVKTDPPAHTRRFRLKLCRTLDASVGPGDSGLILAAVQSLDEDLVRFLIEKQVTPCRKALCLAAEELHLGIVELIVSRVPGVSQISALKTVLQSQPQLCLPIVRALLPYVLPEHIQFALEDAKRIDLCPQSVLAVLDV